MDHSTAAPLTSSVRPIRARRRDAVRALAFLCALALLLADRPLAAQADRAELLLLVTVRAEGALSRDGVAVRAYSGEHDCGGGRTRHGAVVFFLGGDTSHPDCADARRDIIFTVDGQRQPAALPWPTDAFVVAVTLTGPSGGGADGRVVRPLIEPVCRAEGGPCSDEEQARWAGVRSVWRAWLTARGEPLDGDAIWRAWLRLRAERGEVFGASWLAAAEGRPYSYVAAAQYRRGVDGSDPYVLLGGAGPERDVSGWEVRANTGHAYRFPAGARLGPAGCAVFFGAEAATANRAWACPGAAVFSGVGALPAVGGEVTLVDDAGAEIDAVAW